MELAPGALLPHPSGKPPCFLAPIPGECWPPLACLSAHSSISLAHSGRFLSGPLRAPLPSSSARTSANSSLSFPQDGGSPGRCRPPLIFTGLRHLAGGRQPYLAWPWAVGRHLGVRASLQFLLSPSNLSLHSPLRDAGRQRPLQGGAAPSQGAASRSRQRLSGRRAGKAGCAFPPLPVPVHGLASSHPCGRFLPGSSRWFQWAMAPPLSDFQVWLSRGHDPGCVPIPSLRTHSPYMISARAWI